MPKSGQDNFKVGDKVLETSGHTYDRTYSLRIGKVVKVGKSRMKVEFLRKDDVPRVEEFYVESGKKYGCGPYYHHEVCHLTEEKMVQFTNWKSRMIAERTVRGASEKLEKAYRDYVRDDRKESVPTNDLVQAADLIEQALELLTPKQTEEESDERN